ncbi:MAG: ATP-dependent helicase [Candidatus Lokiarchaeota archaeon]|nr:ATP-dependent helicase [Candidatus Lokiarchaeota archaeon]
MPSQKVNMNEKFTFEYYDEDYDDSLDAEISEAIEEYNPVNFESELNEEQLNIVNNLNGPMLVIAGAGSGKTRTIVYAVAKLLVSGIKPSEIMLVTFTNKAASEMIERVEQILGKRPKGIWAGTFHSIANRFLRKYAKSLGLKPNFTIMDETDARGLIKLSRDKVDIKELDERFPTAAMAKSILSYSINCNKTIKEIIEWKYPQFDNDKLILKLREVFKIYAKKKEDDSLVDFDDMLVFWNRLLEERNVAQLIARRIKHVLVDEYQDTNFIQDEIIKKIVQQNPDHNVMAVGDDAQSIYAFRGANFQNIMNFEKNYQDCKKYAITFNYRSIPQILGLANDSINHNKKQFKKQMRPTREDGIKPFQVDIDDDKSQARFIANEVLKLRSEGGYDLHDMAILVRAGHHSLKIELELQRKNIPYEVRAGVAFFEKAHIKDAISYLRIFENPYDEISWSRIFSMIPGIGTKSGSKIFAEIIKMEDPINLMTKESFFSVKLKGSRISQKGKKNWIAHVKKLVNLTEFNDPSKLVLQLIKILEGYMKTKYDNWKDRIEDLKQFSVYAKNYQTIRKFLENLSLNGSNIESKTVIAGNEINEEKPLIISTIHRAKGLEWRVVFIPMLIQDQFPSSKVGNDPDALEEERRTFYVAVTRAKDQLYLISPATVQTFKGFQISGISQFVSELNPKYYTQSEVRFRSKIDKPSQPRESMFKSAKDLHDEGKS